MLNIQLDNIVMEISEIVILKQIQKKIYRSPPLLALIIRIEYIYLSTLYLPIRIGRVIGIKTNHKIKQPVI